MLKHISGQSNRVADALSRILLIMQENQIQVLGFEHIRELYETGIDFRRLTRLVGIQWRWTERHG